MQSNNWLPGTHFHFNAAVLYFTEERVKEGSKIVETKHKRLKINRASILTMIFWMRSINPILEKESFPDFSGNLRILQS